MTLTDMVTGEGDRGARIVALRKELCEKRLVSFFTNPDDLAAAVGIAMNQPSAAPDPLRRAYLSWVIEQVSDVPMAGIDPKSIREESRRDLDLAAVYTALMTRRSEAVETRARQPEREARQLSALEVLNNEPHVALLGDPGSGKSTFVNFVALCLAGELLGRADANLRMLTAPVPQDEREEASEPQPWDRGELLPARVVLREFVARGLASAGEAVSRDTLWQFIVGELPQTLRDFASTLRDEFQNTGGLLLLDGLDEVPQAHQRREQVKAVVEQFAAAFPYVVILVTSRIYAYQEQDWKLKNFTEATLEPFGQAQIRAFVARWYAYVGQARSLSAQEAEGRATLLNHAIENSSRLRELAARPLLLTLMASLHAWRGGALPEQREELYADAVELLLEQWESQKLQHRSDGSFVVAQPSLVEWLRVDRHAMRQLLNRLAYEAHRDQLQLVGTANIAQSTLVQSLMEAQQNPDVRPARIIEYIRDRAGLLEPRGVGIYAFPHLTFQEYLAACHLTDHGFPDELAALLRGEPNRWREVTLLAGAKASRGTAEAAWNLAEALCYEEAPDEPLSDAAGYWGALLAAQVLLENNSLVSMAVRHEPKAARIRAWLLCAMRHEVLPAVERVRAGDALGRMGDARFRAEREDLQASDDRPRVLRGAPFLINAHGTRCAVRSRRDARYASGRMSFRVVAVALP